MMRRFPRLLMVDSLNPSTSFRKAQTLVQRFAIGFIEPGFAIKDNSVGRRRHAKPTICRFADRARHIRSCRLRSCRLDVLRHRPCPGRSSDRVADQGMAGVHAGRAGHGLAALAKLVEFGTTRSFDSLLIARHGRIVLDVYYAPYAPDIPHVINSATKAVIGTLTTAIRL